MAKFGAILLTVGILSLLTMWLTGRAGFQWPLQARPSDPRPRKGYRVGFITLAAFGALAILFGLITGS